MGEEEESSLEKQGKNLVQANEGKAGSEKIIPNPADGITGNNPFAKPPPETFTYQVPEDYPGRQ